MPRNSTGSTTIWSGAAFRSNCCIGAIYGQNPAYLNERFPTEVRATAAGFCYHQGAIWGGLCGPILGAWAITAGGFAVPMLITTFGALAVFVIALLMGPETKGHVMVSDIQLAGAGND